MSTIITALIVLGFLAGVIGLLMWVHKRDQKRDAAQANSSKTLS
jgi:hypothetical protein